MKLFDIYYRVNKYDFRVFRHTKKKVLGLNFTIMFTVLFCCFCILSRTNLQNKVKVFGAVKDRDNREGEEER